MEFSEYELKEIKNEFPYIDYIWKWTKKFNPFEYEMWGNRKVDNFITLTAFQQSGLITTKLYKIDKKSNKIIKDLVISEFDTEKQDFDFDVEENSMNNLMKISKYYNEKYNIKWIPDEKTRFFQIVEVNNILRFIYPKNNKIRTTDFYLSEDSSYIETDELISDISF